MILPSLYIPPRAPSVCIAYLGFCAGVDFSETLLVSVSSRIFILEEKLMGDGDRVAGLLKKAMIFFLL